MPIVTPGYNARGVWLAASGAPTKWMSGSSAGAALYGTSGNDAITTPGGGGSAYGGDGDDSYTLWVARDQVVEFANQGIDTLTSYLASYLLPANLENLVVGNAYASGTGNTLANIIAGSSGTQTIDGGAGDDILSGGAGADDFIMQGGTGWDLITDFETGLDDLVIGGAFTQFTSFTAVQGALTQVGADAVLRLSATDAVTFAGRNVASFTAADFVLPAAAMMPSLRATFSDEFTSFSGSATGLDATKAASWKTTYIWGDRTLSANKEAEYYTDASVGPNPFTVDPAGDGMLTITAAPTAGLPNGLTYSSGVIISTTTLVQTYGFFEMRAQIPSGAGFWPAFWLLRADGRGPTELDVMEILGDAPGRLYMTTHTNQTPDSAAYTTQDLSLDYHTYAVSWRPDGLVFYLDGTAIHATATPADMNSPMYMIANLTVGGVGSWAGPTDGVSSASLNIDYIKAWQFSDLAGPYRPSPVSAFLVMGTWSSDTLIGSNGDDRFESLGGNDVMSGGGGADVFAFSVSGGKDTITDFQSGTDKILAYDMSAVTLSSSVNGLVVTFSPGNNVTLNGVTALNPGDIVYSNAQVSGTSGADVINGSAAVRPQWISASSGADTVTGGAGDDFILGGQGNDVLTGGAGTDIFAFSPWDGADRINNFETGVDRIMLRGVAAQTVWINPSRDAAGNSGLEVDYAVGQSIFLAGRHHDRGRRHHILGLERPRHPGRQRVSGGASALPDATSVPPAAGQIDLTNFLFLERLLGTLARFPYWMGDPSIVSVRRPGRGVCAGGALSGAAAGGCQAAAPFLARELQRPALRGKGCGTRALDAQRLAAVGVGLPADPTLAGGGLLRSAGARSAHAAAAIGARPQPRADRGRDRHPHATVHA